MHYLFINLKTSVIVEHRITAYRYMYNPLKYYKSVLWFCANPLMFQEV